MESDNVSAYLYLRGAAVAAVAERRYEDAVPRCDKCGATDVALDLDRLDVYRCLVVDCNEIHLTCFSCQRLGF